MQEPLLCRATNPLSQRWTSVGLAGPVDYKRLKAIIDLGIPCMLEISNQNRLFMRLKQYPVSRLFPTPLVQLPRLITLFKNSTSVQETAAVVVLCSRYQSV